MHQTRNPFDENDSENQTPVPLSVIAVSRVDLMRWVLFVSDDSFNSVQWSGFPLQSVTLSCKYAWNEIYSQTRLDVILLLMPWNSDLWWNVKKYLCKIRQIGFEMLALQPQQTVHCCSWCMSTLYGFECDGLHKVMRRLAGQNGQGLDWICTIIGGDCGHKDKEFTSLIITIFPARLAHSIANDFLGSPQYPHNNIQITMRATRW